MNGLFSAVGHASQLLQQGGERGPSRRTLRIKPKALKKWEAASKKRPYNHTFFGLSASVLWQQNSIISSIDTHTFSASATSRLEQR